MSRLFISRLFICALLALSPVAVESQNVASVEQQIEALRSQLRDVTDKEAALQERARQIDEDLRPENIERSVAGIGTTDARALRDERQQQLERQKAKVEEQLASLATSRSRLETAIASAEAEVVRLKASALSTSNAPSQTEAPATTVPTAEKTSAKKPKKVRAARKRTRRVRPRQ